MRESCNFAALLCFRGVVQLASILAWGASGRPFESGHSDEMGFFPKLKPANRMICGLLYFFQINIKRIFTPLFFSLIRFSLALCGSAEM